MSQVGEMSDDTAFYGSEGTTAKRFYDRLSDKDEYNRMHVMLERASNQFHAFAKEVGENRHLVEVIVAGIQRRNLAECQAKRIIEIREKEQMLRR